MSSRPQLCTTLKTKTSVVQAFKEISQQELSGQLIIKSLNFKGNGWRVYFGKGKLHYATSLVANQERIKYLISQNFPELIKETSPTFEEEYSDLCSFWSSGKITLQKLRKILYHLTQEAIMHCLASPPIRLEFRESVGLDPILMSVNVKEVASPVRPKILKWMKLRAGIRSPLLRVGIDSVSHFYEAIAKHSALYNLKPLAQPLTRFPNLYQLATEFDTDVLTLSEQLQPYVLEKDVQIRAYQQLEAPQGEAPVIACIDDSNTVQHNVKLTLEAAGYEVISLTKPARALSTLARKKPVLILMDITMPEMNGYDLSRLLRKSNSLAETPIIMLTGRDGMVDRLRARMVGANDYITKPFNPHQLIALVEQHTRQSKMVSV